VSANGNDSTADEMWTVGTGLEIGESTECSKANNETLKYSATVEDKGYPPVSDDEVQAMFGDPERKDRAWVG